MEGMLVRSGVLGMMEYAAPTELGGLVGAGLQRWRPTGLGGTDGQGQTPTDIDGVDCVDLVDDVDRAVVSLFQAGWFSRGRSSAAQPRAERFNPGGIADLKWVLGVTE